MRDETPIIPGRDLPSFPVFGEAPGDGEQAPRSDFLFGSLSGSLPPTINDNGFSSMSSPSGMLGAAPSFETDFGAMFGVREPPGDDSSFLQQHNFEPSSENTIAFSSQVHNSGHDGQTSNGNGSCGSGLDPQFTQHSWNRSQPPHEDDQNEDEEDPQEREVVEDESVGSLGLDSMLISPFIPSAAAFRRKKMPSFQEVSSSSSSSSTAMTDSPIVGGVQFQKLDRGEHRSGGFAKNFLRMDDEEEKVPHKKVIPLSMRSSPVTRNMIIPPRAPKPSSRVPTGQDVPPESSIPEADLIKMERKIRTLPAQNRHRILNMYRDIHREAGGELCVVVVFGLTKDVCVIWNILAVVVVVVMCVRCQSPSVPFFHSFLFLPCRSILPLTLSLSLILSLSPPFGFPPADFSQKEEKPIAVPPEPKPHFDVMNDAEEFAAKMDEFFEKEQNEIATEQPKGKPKRGRDDFD